MFGIRNVKIVQTKTMIPDKENIEVQCCSRRNPATFPPVKEPE